jgi:hypothetical protein
MAAAHRPAMTRRNKREDLISRYSFPFSKGMMLVSVYRSPAEKQEN